MVTNITCFGKHRRQEETILVIVYQKQSCASIQCIYPDSSPYLPLLYVPLCHPSLVLELLDFCIYISVGVGYL
ncbi:hypothetical protein K435DRAFT_787549 [Dendrothele bispora CBS 962.96]|uniref:Uncharacterized protein n=1 Tax=Dendrothele bispora (strain CBS 962.96) TaxID=1314807 RepID=A0A4S8KJP3_DENBC|nr:hypothetical protein K435DRAFT_787549 [Dendrothele bispora CBS 962.96]